MISVFFAILLAISVGVLIYMASKDYETIDIRFWTIVVLVPIVILGYWLKSTVTTAEAAKFAFSYIYLDSTVLLMVVLFAMLHFMGIRAARWVKVLAYGSAFVHMFLIWACMHNDLYYKSIELIDTGMGIATKMESGPLKIFHWIYIVLAVIVIVAIVIAAWVKRGTYSRRTLWMYTVLMSVGILIYVVETLIDVDFSSLPALYVLADLMIAFNYDHAHTHDITSVVSKHRDQQDVRGFAAFDFSGHFLSCNEKM
nr:hypothetical protein [Eubacterium sp.]